MALDRILLVDDDTELCDLLAEYLGREGFAVDSVFDGAAGLKKALSGEYGLVVLDVMLPEPNGFEVLRRIRAHSGLPVIMLTARGEDVDRIVGLELGADDYLPKPFNPREMLARIRAVLRRSDGRREQEEDGGALIADGDLLLDPRSLAATLGGKSLGLTAAECRLLCLLVGKKGAVVFREELSKGVLGRDYSPLDRSLDVHISNLRKKLAKAGGDPARILAVRSEGYCYSRLHESREAGLPEGA